jgi:RNA polymerase sigma-70 factor, ECF subfamily
MEQLSAWLERARRGDQAALRELYRGHRPKVVRLVSGFAGLDPDEVQDVVQDTFIRAFRALSKLKDAASFEPWLLSIARNRAVSAARRKAGLVRATMPLGQEEEPIAPPIAAALQREREVAMVRELIAELPSGPEKETVELFYVQGELSASQIAERLGVGKSAVTMRLERFRGKVKRELLRRVLASRME